MIPADSNSTQTRLARKRIGLLTASASRLGGGVFEAVVNQAAIIREAGGEAVVFGLSDDHAIDDAARFAPSSVYHIPRTGPAQIGFSPELTARLLSAELDLLHLHGIWMYPSRAATLWARVTGRPYVISPHGMLDRWITARGRLKKGMARLVYERASWRSATVLHGLTQREAEDIQRESGRNDSIVIPNAVPLSEVEGSKQRSAEFLYLGRIHPKKNIAALLAAWTERARDLSARNARLTIAGWGDEKDVADLRANLAFAPDNVRFVGPLFGKAKADAFRRAGFFILPSLSEGLPMAVLEAWASATPVLMTTECNLPEGFENGAALDCGFDSATIGAAIDRAVAMQDSEWSSLSQAALRLAKGPFSPNAITARWAACYHDLLHR